MSHAEHRFEYDYAVDDIPTDKSAYLQLSYLQVIYERIDS
jgi:hypothetical protein